MAQLKKISFQVPFVRIQWNKKQGTTVSASQSNKIFKNVKLCDCANNLNQQGDPKTNRNFQKPHFIKMVKDLAIIVAAASTKRGIGYQGKLPWRLPADMEHFKKVTTETTVTGDESSLVRNAVIMGRKTWDSIPKCFRPLSGRVNIVISKHPQHVLSAFSQSPITNDNSHSGDLLVADSIQQGYDLACRIHNIDRVFIIGGSQIYEQALSESSGLPVNRIVYTEVSNLPQSVEFDTFFPNIDEEEWKCLPYVSWNTTDESKTQCATNLISSIDDKENNPGNEATNTVHIDGVSGITYRFLDYIRRRPIGSTIHDSSKMASMELKPTGAHPIPAPANGSNKEVFPLSMDSSSMKESLDSMNHEEMQYLNLCRDVLQNGVYRGDRTGTGTLSKFGAQMRFSLRNNSIPLLTTKRTFWRGVAEELLWFIAGNTNANDLANKNIHIWDGNGSREFLDNRGLSHREVGDLGPVYGFQWRHFGAKYVDMKTNYSGQGVDQLADCIYKIIHTPEDRRIILSAWNPCDLDKMALPPCHMFCQFYVDTATNEVSCQMYQRSADLGLGVPFNIASYSLLTILIAFVTGRLPGDFIHTIGDAHIYMNHVDALQVQLQRSPRPFPKLFINPRKKRKENMTIDDFTIDDFDIQDYHPYGPIKMKMAV